MSTSTSTTGKTSTSTPIDSAVRPGRHTGEHVMSMQFGAWGPQDVILRAYSDGGRGGAPYIVVGVGTCLAYAYDSAAVASFLCAGAKSGRWR